MDDFVLPVENRLGAEGDGIKIDMRALQPGRVAMAPKALGVARARCENAERYVKGQLRLSERDEEDAGDLAQISRVEREFPA